MYICDTNKCQSTWHIGIYAMGNMSIKNDFIGIFPMRLLGYTQCNTERAFTVIAFEIYYLIKIDIELIYFNLK